MTFSVNTSPFAGQEGKYVTSRNLKVRRMVPRWLRVREALLLQPRRGLAAAGARPRAGARAPTLRPLPHPPTHTPSSSPPLSRPQDRLERELERNLALRVEPGEGAESFEVSGRG